MNENILYVYVCMYVCMCMYVCIYSYLNELRSIGLLVQLELEGWMI